MSAREAHWAALLNEMGVPTFVLDSFTGRGFRHPFDPASTPSPEAMSVDAYRALALLSTHPRLDPTRIALMGFSRGCSAALYASLTRFQRLHGPAAAAFAAYLAFDPLCHTTSLDDEQVSDRPIRIVVPVDVVDVPSQAEIDMQAKVEADHLLALIEKARGLGKTIRSEPGPNGTTFWFVRAGVFDTSGELRGQLFDFLPKNLTVKAGDTVIWQSVDTHTITFNPMPPAPDPHIVKAQADGPPLLLENPKVFRPSKPAQVYDPAQYFNSALLGMTTPRGTSWALTFDTPGVYEYICALHEPMGMKGTITVVPR